MRNFYLGLVHSPVKNKWGKEVITSVTNLDVHDIARSCRTFNFKRFFVITPVWQQHELLQKMLGYWEGEAASKYNPDRHSALANVKIANTIDESIAMVQELEDGDKPLIVVTGANLDKEQKEKIVGTSELVDKILLDNRPLLLLFGTGHGLASSVIETADYCLAPIKGHANDGYNHLSVRSAVAIYCENLRRNLIEE